MYAYRIAHHDYIVRGGVQSQLTEEERNSLRVRGLDSLKWDSEAEVPEAFVHQIWEYRVRSIYGVSVSGRYDFENARFISILICWPSITFLFGFSLPGNGKYISVGHYFKVVMVAVFFITVFKIPQDFTIPVYVL